MITSFFDFPIIGSITVGLALAINALIIRYILQYLRETREEYSRRLTRAIIELESQKTLNIQLKYENERLNNLLST